MFKGGFSSNKIDNLPVIAPAAYVFNTELIGGPGTHWAAVYIDMDRFTTYFDTNEPQQKIFIHFLAKRGN